MICSIVTFSAGPLLGVIAGHSSATPNPQSRPEALTSDQTNLQQFVLWGLHPSQGLEATLPLFESTRILCMLVSVVKLALRRRNRRGVHSMTLPDPSKTAADQAKRNAQQTQKQYRFS
jgi:hypothetical protein